MHAVFLLSVLACKDPDAHPKPPVTTCDTADFPVGYVPTAPVEVTRDARGIPHLYAQNDADLFWASGYQVATDRLFEIDTFARAARGTLAEVRGEDSLSDDLTARTFDFGRYACESLALIAEERPDDYALVVAYVSGIDDRIADVRAGDAPLPWGFGPDELDYLPEPLEMADVIRMGQRINLGYSSTIEYDILYSLMVRLASNYQDIPVFLPGPERFVATTSAPEGHARRAAPAGPAPAWTDAEAQAFLDGVMALRHATYRGEGSNNWAVNGAYTDNGRPLIANDPHSSLHSPNSLYPQHMNSADAGGNFDVAGFSFPGIPGVQLGHNASVAWAATTNYSDQTDIWDIAVDDGFATVGTERVPVDEREETITVRMDDGSLEERAYTIQEVDGYGVILPDELLPVPSSLFAGGAVLVNWVGFAPTDELFMYLDMDRADDLGAFEGAVDLQRVGMHNWMGATADGIRYRTHGLIPDRGPVEGRPQANQVLDGSDASTFWTGEYLPDDDLPRLDGTQAYFASANNDPWGHTADNDPLNDDFYYGSFFSPSFRADRISSELERIMAAGPATVADMQALQLDTYSSIAATMIPLLVEAASRIDTDDELADFRGRQDLSDAVTTLAAWDFRMDRDSVEAALFRAWQSFVSRRTLASDLSLLFVPVENSSPVTIAKVNLLCHTQGIDSVLDGRGDYDLLAGLDDALGWVADRTAEAGVSALTYGDVHREEVHPTWGDSTFLSTPGDESTPNVGQCHFWNDSDPVSSCDGDEAAIFRSVTSFADDGVPETVFNIAYGIDGDADRWRDGVYEPFVFRRADVDAAATETFTLSR